MAKAVPIHKDIIGNVIKVGDTVVSPSGRELEIGVVEKIHNKTIDVKLVKQTSWRWPTIDRRYPNNLLIVNDPKITLYILKNSKVEA